MSLPLANRQRNELLFVGFNQDSGCFACGTDTGFRIYNCDPFKEMFRRHFTRGGIGIVEMLLDAISLHSSGEVNNRGIHQTRS